MSALFHFLLLWSTMQSFIFGAGWNPLASRAVASAVNTVGWAFHPRRAIKSYMCMDLILNLDWRFEHQPVVDIA